MPKVSKTTATTHQGFPGYGEMYSEEIGNWSVVFGGDFADLDQTPFFKGAPGDMCQAHHMGYMLKGKFGIRKADGTEEIYEAGDMFVIEPGHIPLSFAGGEYVVFTPKEELQQQMAYMMPNLMEFAKEHGIELPGEMTSA